MNKDLSDLIVYSGLSHTSLAKRIESHLDQP